MVNACHRHGPFVSTHSRLKAAGNADGNGDGSGSVSTHSRLKAAGTSDQQQSIQAMCFNTQPPEGGWFGCYR